MYSELLSRRRPGCILILLDRSGSMADPFAGRKDTSKQQECAHAVNRVLREIVLSCRKGADIAARCHIGVLGYGGGGVASAFGGKLAGRDIVPVDDVASAPLRIERPAASPREGDGRGRTLAAPQPIWIEPVGDGGTPMDAALKLAGDWLRSWTRSNRSSFPPVVINITDGEPNDAAAVVREAGQLTRIETDDGSALLLNVHISETRAEPIALPSSPADLPDDFAKFLFDISSVLPEPLCRSANMQGFQTAMYSRGFIYNADVDTLVRLLQFGSRPNQHR